MKHSLVNKTVTALAITLLSQPLFATDLLSSNDCYVAAMEESVTIDVSKFTDVWLKLHVNNNNFQNQAHLQKYLENALDKNKGTLDVEKFSHVWNKIANRTGNEQKHLKEYLIESLEHASQGETCAHK